MPTSANKRRNMQDHENQPLRHGRDVDSSMNCTFCTTGTKTTLSNCNCEISMVRTMGNSHSEKQGCQRPWRTATAEQGHLSLTNTGTTTTLSENCTMKMKSWTMGNCLCATTGMSGQPGICRCTTKSEHTFVQELHLPQAAVD